MTFKPPFSANSRQTFSRAIKEPLFHFFVAGAIVWLVYGGTGLRPREGTSTVFVSPQQLLDFRQSVVPAMDESALESMGPERLKRLINAFVKEEVLYREASALGLDYVDSVTKRRAVQRLLYVIRSGSDVTLEPTPFELEEYFRKNEGSYLTPSTVSFANVFFSYAIRGKEKAVEDARRAMDAMNANSVTHSQAIPYGDRPMYGSYYADKERAEVSNYFGVTGADLLFGSGMDSRAWMGPLQSPYGAHVVLLLGRRERVLPSLGSIEDRVKRDFYAWHQRRVEDEAVEKFTRRYKVKFAPELEALINETPRSQ